jgi:hypothetical protein
MYKSLNWDDHLSRRFRPIAVSHCDREVSIMRGASPTRGCCTIGKKSREGEGKTGITECRRHKAMFSDY